MLFEFRVKDPKFGFMAKTRVKDFKFYDFLHFRKHLPKNLENSWETWGLDELKILGGFLTRAGSELEQFSKYCFVTLVTIFTRISKILIVEMDQNLSQIRAKSSQNWFSNVQLIFKKIPKTFFQWVMEGKTSLATL